MYANNLCDLVLGGIVWELTEAPLSTQYSQQTNVAQKNTDTGGVRTTIVPPIAPIQTISVETAVAMAARPMDIDSLFRMISEFNHPLRTGVTNVVLPNIATKPNGLVVITDIPGTDDDASGNIMSGAAGEMLDKMLNAIGMSRETVSILPMLFWRTPGGRTPSRTELDLARPFVNRVLEFTHPRVILTLGTLPAVEIGNVTLPRDHGKLIDIQNDIKLVPIFHPNYMLLKPNAKRDAWNALQIVQNLLKNAQK